MDYPSGGPREALGFCGGDERKALGMGVSLTRADRLRVAATAPFILGRMRLLTAATKQPLLRGAADASTVRTLRKRPAGHGTPEYSTEHTTGHTTGHTAPAR